MPASKTTILQQNKAYYAAPQLTIFGSVRQLTGAKSGTGTDGQTKFVVPSDRSYKENIVKIDDHPVGFGLYLFDYKPEYCNQFGYGRRFGVMADEVEKVVPEAILLDVNGLRKVNYALLDIRLH